MVEKSEDESLIGKRVVGELNARQLRERDPACKIILVDDTQEFAIRSMRLHCTDFILRPVEFRHIVRSMNLALRGWQ